MPFFTQRSLNEAQAPEPVVSCSGGFCCIECRRKVLSEMLVGLDARRSLFVDCRIPTGRSGFYLESRMTMKRGVCFGEPDETRQPFLSLRRNPTGRSGFYFESRMTVKRGVLLCQAG
jgi:hypothetical protein